MPTIFQQIVSVLYPSEFARCAAAFPAPRVARSLSSYDHFLALCFAQLTFRQSLRDLVACLGSQPAQLYQMGFRGTLSRTNLAYAGKHRDWRIFHAAAQVLMRRAARLYQPDEPELASPQLTFALDSSLIQLSLKLLPWARYTRQGAAGLKLHLLLSLQGNLPGWGILTEATFPDMKMLDRVPVAPGAGYIMDRGYLDFRRLFRLHREGAWFVVRSKRHVNYQLVQASPVPKRTRELIILRDDLVGLKTKWSAKSFPAPLRRVRIYVRAEKKTLELLTDRLDCSALEVAGFYKSRWQVELFFKWIKQHLRLQHFYGRSENAVCSQVWSAICAYLMVAILKKQRQLPNSLYEMLQVINVNPFAQQDICELLNQKNQRLAITPSAETITTQRLLTGH